MADFVEGADGESVLIGYLRNLMGQQPGFESVEVVGAMPSSSRDYEPPAEAVTVRLTGGTPRDVLVDDLQLTITAWAGGPGEDVRASDICRRTAGLIRAAERLGYMGATVCTSVRVLSLPYMDPDPVTSRARYSATFVVSMRGQVVRT